MASDRYVCMHARVHIVCSTKLYDQPCIVQDTRFNIVVSPLLKAMIIDNCYNSVCVCACVHECTCVYEFTYVCVIQRERER